MGYFEAIGVTFANLKKVAAQARAKHYAEWKARKEEIEKMVTNAAIKAQGWERRNVGRAQNLL